MARRNFGTGLLVRGLTALAVALGSAGVLADVAQAQDPAGTVVLTSQTKGVVPNRVTFLQAADDTSIVGGTNDDRQLLVPGADGTAYQELPADQYVEQLAGDWIEYGHENSSGDYCPTVRNVKTSLTRAVPGCPYILALTATTVFWVNDNGVLKGMTLATGATKTYPVPYEPFDLTAGPAGLLMQAENYDPDTDTSTGVYNYFPYADTAAVTTLAAPATTLDEAEFFCDSVNSTYAACAVGGYDGSNRYRTQPYLVPLTGADALPQQHDYLLADGVRAWHDEGDYSTLNVEIGGDSSSYSDVSEVLPTAHGLVWVSNAGVLTRASTSGVHTIPLSLGLANLETGTVALAPGRVAWNDTSSAGYNLWSRTLTRSGNTLSAAAAGSPLVTHSSPTGVALSGAWTLFNDKADGAQGTVWKVIRDGKVRALTPQLRSMPTGAISGSRVLTDGLKMGGARTTTLHNLVTGQDVDLSRTLGKNYEQLDLWGDYVAWVDYASGQPEVKVLRLSDGSVRLFSRVAASGYVEMGGMADGRLFYTVHSYNATTDDYSTRHFLQDLGSAAVSNVTKQVGTGRSGIALTSNGYLVLDNCCSEAGGSALVGFGGAVTAVPETDYNSDHIAVSDDVMAWVGSDGRPRVQPLPHVANAPAYLGNADTPTRTTDGTWAASVMTSHALTTCSFTIRDAAGRLVRTLPCDGAAARQGEAAVTWDGADGAGHRVAVGSYTWSLAAGNQDGVLRNVDAVGAAHLGGVITVLAEDNLFTPVSPRRVLDTRSGVGVRRGAVPARGVVTLRVPGLPSDATAVTLNVTAAEPTRGGFVTVYPGGTPRPNASTLNFASGQTIPNMITVAVGAGGTVSFYNFSGSTQLIADLAGYFTKDTGSRFAAVSPRRVLDTRSGVGVRRGAVPARGVVTLTVPGLPAGATAVTLNVTATEPTRGGFVTVYPGGTRRPNASTLNFTAGETIPNMITVAVGAGGKVSFYNFSGSTQLIADLAGYYGTGPGSTFTAAAPRRVLDTRSGVGVRRGAVPARGVVTLTVPGLPAGATAVTLNVTATDPTRGGFVTVYPGGTRRPNASTLNFTAGETIPNMITVAVGAGGKVSFYNLSGSIQLIADLAGYYE